MCLSSHQIEEKLTALRQYHDKRVQLQPSVSSMRTAATSSSQGVERGSGEWGPRISREYRRSGSVGTFGGERPGSFDGAGAGAGERRLSKVGQSSTLRRTLSGGSEISGGGEYY